MSSDPQARRARVISYRNTLPADPLVGRVLDSRYRLLEVIGRGGFGTVYRARHERVPRNLAVKVLPTRWAKDPASVARFEREMRAEAALAHPHIVQVVDYGFVEDVGYYIAMELLEGVGLDTRMEMAGVLPILETYRVIEQTCSALGAAHARGVVHRDLKAENIFLVNGLADQGAAGFEVRLLDFGVARIMRPDADLTGLEAEHIDAAVVGTPYTMAPEQIRNLDMDHRVDIYALGVVVYEMLTGSLPFDAQSLQELWHLHLTQPPKPPSQVEDGEWIPTELDAVVLKMLAKRRKDRYGSVSEVVEAFEAVRARVEDAWAEGHLTGAYPSEPTAAPAARSALPRLRSTVEREGDNPVVLIVDDERSIRRLLGRLATQAGFDCVLAQTGAEALGWLATEPSPAAITLDVLLWGQDGLSVLREIRALGYEGVVILCTGLDVDGVREEAHRLGPTRLVAKSSSLHEVSDVLTRLHSSDA